MGFKASVNFWLYRYSDGTVSVKLKGSGTKQSGTPAVKYDIKVDLDNGIYRAAIVNDLGTKSTNVPMTLIGPFSAYVGLTTDDAVGADLCITENTLEWYGNTNGTVLLDDYDYDYWAANPSSFNTHWYIDSSSGKRPWYSSGDEYIYSENEADYYNYDFLDNDEITTAWHWIEIRGTENGNFTYRWDYEHDGEAAGILDIDIDVE